MVTDIHYTLSFVQQENPAFWELRGRFASFVMDEPYSLPGGGVRQNPIARTTRGRCRATEPWSIAGAHLAGKEDRLRTPPL